MRFSLSTVIDGATAFIERRLRRDYGLFGAVEGHGSLRFGGTKPIDLAADRSLAAGPQHPRLEGLIAIKRFGAFAA